VQQGAGGFGGGLVLDGHVRAEALAVLRREPVVPLLCQVRAQRGQCGRLKRVGDAAAQEAQPGRSRLEGRLGRAPVLQLALDSRYLLAGQVMEQGDVRRDEVAVGWEVQGAQPLEPRLVVCMQPQRQDKRRGVQAPGR